MNLSSSAYFAMGAVTVTIVVIVLLVAPLVNQMKQLDKVVMDKLSLLPTTDTYSTLFSIITDQNQLNDGLLVEYETIKNHVKNLTTTIGGLNDFQDTCDTKMTTFLTNIKQLEDSLKQYENILEFNGERSSKQINSLVTARIETTTFLIELVDMLKQDNKIPSGFNGARLYTIREELRIGAESIKNMNYKGSQYNQKSGTIDKLTNSKY